MFYAQLVCPFCKGGTVGFRLCSDGTTIVLMCDECDAVWLRADAVSLESPIFPSSPDYRVEGSGCSVATVYGSRWAKYEELLSSGVDSFIAGESDA